MEDDDEFGDLYTDVLRPFAPSSSSSASQPRQPSAAPQPLRPPIDLNLQNDEDEDDFRSPSSNPAVSGVSSGKTQAPAAKIPVPSEEVAKLGQGSNSSFGIRCQDENLIEKEVTFDIEEGDVGMEEDGGSEPVIPGLESSVPVRAATSAADIENLEACKRDGSVGGDGVDGGDDWDSDDSEDDLQIVLNDINQGPMAMERDGMAGGDDDDEEDGLVIVADGDPNQAIEEQDWGEDAVQAVDGERKEMGEGGKPGGGIGGGTMASKIGYSNHGYHPFHSQFKVSVSINVVA